MRRWGNKLTCGIAVLLAGLILICGWDFLQIGRTTPAMAAIEQRATMIVVDKSIRKLTLLHDSRPLRTYDISLGRLPVGRKEREGDRHTPEGMYVIDSKNARSHFHLGLHVSYPNASDRDHAQRTGFAPGGDIMLHGLPNGLGWLGKVHRALDWTDGCIAVTNSQVEEIWALVEIGTPIEIRP
jgi:murein L,D-transpeptidase YafK